MRKTIQASVGASGINNSDDVQTVQVLLNKARGIAGQRLIAVDGLVREGGETIGAICDFQTQRFGWSDPDGRVDPRGQTLAALNDIDDEALLEPVRHYPGSLRKSKYRVDMAADGEIKVKPGDWLSKYSAAIKGNFYSVLSFARLDSTGKLIPIRNTNRITSFESIYYLPVWHEFHKSKFVDPIITNEEKAKFDTAILAEEYNIRGEHLEFLHKLLSDFETGAAGAEVTETFLEHAVEELLGAGFLGATAFLDQIAFTVEAGIALINAQESLQKLTGYRAAAYATTAWAFEDDPPEFSHKWFLRICPGGVPRTEGEKAEIERNQKAWEEAIELTHESLENLVASGAEKLAKAATIERWRAAVRQRLIDKSPDRSPASLSKALMKVYEKRFNGAMLTMWTKGYNILYPD
jgi:hypothetical protein